MGLVHLGPVLSGRWLRNELGLAEKDTTSSSLRGLRAGQGSNPEHGAGNPHLQVPTGTQIRLYFLLPQAWYSSASEAVGTGPLYREGW